jgi:hypothetical protein
VTRLLGDALAEGRPQEVAGIANLLGNAGSTAARDALHGKTVEGTVVWAVSSLASAASPGSSSPGLACASGRDQSRVIVRISSTVIEYGARS